MCISDKKKDIPNVIYILFVISSKIMKLILLNDSERTFTLLWFCLAGYVTVLNKTFLLFGCKYKINSSINVKS